MKAGKVYLVGAGPGDPKLITVRGQELLQQADLVVYDHLVSPRLLQMCAPQAKRVYVGKESGRPPRPALRGRLDGGRSASRHTMSQRAINALLVRSAKAGKMVVRLKGGDPFLFGRGGEEAVELAKAGVSHETVPGITSALAVPAYAGIPVTYRGLSSSVAIITGHEDPTKPESAIRWDRVATACDTFVCLMGVATLPQVTRQLLRFGRRATTPCAVVEWGTTPRQRTVTGTLRTIAQKATRASIRPPAVFIAGEVVSVRRHLNWFETRPLSGRRILVTRASDKAGPFADQLEALGAEVVRLPAIELVPVKQNGVFRTTLNELPKADWVFFTSPEGIGWFSKMLKPYRKDVRLLSGCHIGAIGPKTAVAVEEAGLHVDFVPKQFSLEGVLADFPRRVLNGKRAVILSAEGSRDLLETGLRKRGMRVSKVAIYRTAIPKALLNGVAGMLQHPFDYVTVTSASCVEHLYQAVRAAGRPRLFRRLRFASIGPITSRAVRAHGGTVAVEAKSSTVEGLVDVMVKRSSGHT